MYETIFQDNPVTGKREWVDTQTVFAVPYDYPIPGKKKAAFTFSYVEITAFLG